MQRYEKYRDSGIDWLGEIPEHWEVKPGFTVLKERMYKNKGMKSRNVLSLSYGKIIEKPIDKLTGLVPENFENYQLVFPGDIIFRPTDLQNDKVSMRTGLSMFKGIITSAYINLQPFNSCPEFIHYFLRTIDNNKVIYGIGSGLRQNISYSDFKRFNIAVPPLHEQESIAKFLDDKCAKIDTAIGLKQQQIEKLKELRQITIHNAVTKGIRNEGSRDGTVSMKDSCIEWIGEIPAHWEVKRLKNFVKNLEGGVSVNGSESESASSGEIGVLKTSAVYKYFFDPTENKKVFGNEIKRVSCPVKKEAIIISRMNAPELVGASGIVLKDYPNLYLPDRLWQTVYNSHLEFDKFWLSKILISRNFRSSMIIFANGSSPSMKNISKGDFLNIFIPVPPISEQEEIVAYLDKQTSKIDTAISQKQEQIAKLKEYKQSLINDVVTGKIKVV